MLLAAMAGKAGNAQVAVEISLIDLPDHGEHLARDYFVVVFIAREVAHSVARGAADAETESKGAHCRHYFVGFQNLEICRRTHWSTAASRRRTGWGFLSKGNGREKKYR
jgi:hypothetical protein